MSPRNENESIIDDVQEKSSNGIAMQVDEDINESLE
jgi:hypothetical protein